MAAFEPFAVSLPSDRQGKLSREIARTLFGSRDDDNSDIAGEGADFMVEPFADAGAKIIKATK